MFLVEHYVSKSQIHGLGVFIAQPVKKNSFIWTFDPNFDIELPGNILAVLTEDDAEFVLNHAEYFSKMDVFRLGNDGDIFMNHSESPNLLDLGDVMLAARDLVAGDELTCDYRIVRVLGFEKTRAACPKDCAV